MLSQLEILSVRVGPYIVGMNLREVREVSRFTALHPLPKVPPFVLGMVNLRGEIWTLLDMKRILLKEPSSVRSGEDKLLVTRYPSKRVAFLVEEILDILELGAGELKPLRKEGPGRETFLGEIYYRNRILPVLNLGGLISQDMENLAKIPFQDFLE